MIYSGKKEDFRFIMFIFVSALINIAFVTLIPSCTKSMERNELKYESIRTGLRSLQETDKREFVKANKADNKEPNESFSKENQKSQQNESVSPNENNSKTSGKDAIVSNSNIVSKPKFSGPTRDDGGIDGIITSVNSKSLREKSDGINNGKFGANNNSSDLGIKGSEIKGIDTLSKNLQEGTKAVEMGNFDRNSIGIDMKNTGSDSKDTYISINDKGINNSIPKNVSYSTVDISGGRVIFRKYLAPQYPAEAEANGWNGDVEVEFVVREGKTTFAGITGKSGYSVIDRAVEKAAKSWLLAIEKNGVSVNGKVRVKVEFNF